MDVLIFKKSQALIVEHYQESGEIEAIKRAVSKAKENPIKTLSMKVRRYHQFCFSDHRCIFSLLKKQFASLLKDCISSVLSSSSAML